MTNYRFGGAAVFCEDCRLLRQHIDEGCGESPCKTEYIYAIHVAAKHGMIR